MNTYNTTVDIIDKKLVIDWVKWFGEYDGQHKIGPGYAAPKKTNRHPDYWGFREIIVRDFSFKKNHTDGKVDIDKVYASYQTKVAARFRRYGVYYTAKRRANADQVFNSMINYISY